MQERVQNGEISQEEYQSNVESLQDPQQYFQTYGTEEESRQYDQYLLKAKYSQYYLAGAAFTAVGLGFAGATMAIDLPEEESASSQPCKGLGC